MSEKQGGPQLLLIRHAQSQNNAKDESQRVNDPSITVLGTQQAEKLSQFLSGMKFESILSSAFRRAMQTAGFISSSAKLPVEVVIDIHEHGGCYEGWHQENFVGQPGMTAGELEKEFGEVKIPEDYPADGWWRSKPRESHGQSEERAKRMAVYLRDRLVAAEDSLACVTHADFLAKLLVALFGHGIEQEKSFHDLKNVGITRIGINKSKLKLLEVNSVDFLPLQLVSS